MRWRLLFFGLLIAPAYAAQSSSWAVVCTASCTALDGTSQPAGTTIEKIWWDGVSNWSPPANTQVVPYTGQTVYTPPSPSLTAAQQGAAAIASGVTITWSASTTLNGTYAMDVPTQSNVQAELLAILVNGTFTNGTAAIAWPDVSGNLRNFSVAQFKALATVLGAFVGAVDAFVLGVGAMPATTAAVNG